MTIYIYIMNEDLTNISMPAVTPEIHPNFTKDKESQDLQKHVKNEVKY